MTLVYDPGDTLPRRLAQVTTFAVFYGIFVLLFSITTSTFVRRGIPNKLLACLFLATFVTFFIASTVLAASIAGLATYIKAAAASVENATLTAARTLSTYVIQEWTTQILPLFVNAIIIWRASVICEKKSTVFLLPSVILLLGSLATIFTYLGFVAASSTDTVPAGPGIVLKVGLALSLASNLITTLYITHYLRDEREGTRARSSRGFSPELFFVESGALFCCLQLVYLILYLRTPHVATFAAGLTYQIYTAAYFSIAAMYPTIVVSIVIYQRSITDMLGMKVDVGVRSNDCATGAVRTRPVTLGHLSFNIPLSSSTFGNALIGEDDASSIHGIGFQPPEPPPSFIADPLDDELNHNDGEMSYRGS